jgi:hypothetical protein
MPLLRPSSTLTMDPNRDPRRRTRSLEMTLEEGYEYGGESLEMQASTPAEAPIQSAAAAKNDDESLYEQLLRHHRDSNVDDSDTFDGMSMVSEEDRKLPAIDSQSQARPRRPITLPLPYSRDHVVFGKAPAVSEFPPMRHEAETESVSESPMHRNVAPPRKMSASDVTHQSTNTNATDSNRKIDHRTDLLQNLYEESSFYKAALEALGESKSEAPPLPPRDDVDVTQDEQLARELSQLFEEPDSHSALDEKFARALQAAQDSDEPPDSEEQDVALALQLMEQEEQQQHKHKHPINTVADEELAVRLSKELNFGEEEQRLNGDELLARQLSNFETNGSWNGPAQMLPEQLQILERIQQDKERQLIEQAIMESSLQELPAFQEPPDIGVGLSFTGSGNEEDYRLSQELALREWSALQPPRADSRASEQQPTHRPNLRYTRSMNDQSLSSSSRPLQSNNSARSQFDGNFVPGRAVSVDTTGRETSIQPRLTNPGAYTQVPVPLQARTLSFDPPGRATNLGGLSQEEHRNEHSLTSRNQEVSASPRAQQDFPPVQTRSRSFQPLVRSTQQVPVPLQARTRSFDPQGRLTNPGGLSQEEHRNEHSWTGRNQEVSSSPRAQQDLIPVHAQTRSFQPVGRPTNPGGVSQEEHRNERSSTGRNQEVSASPRLHQDLMRPRPPDELLRRGNQETQTAIATGRSHVVVCQGCGNRLHAPRSYSLVFCPTCSTISPGLVADNDSRGESSSIGESSR